MNNSFIKKYLKVDELEGSNSYTFDEDMKDRELKSSVQTLISIVIDKSYPLNGNNELKECVKRTIEKINEVFNMPLKQSRNLNEQVAITYFGSEVELQPFRPAKHIEVNCAPNQTKSRIYDAIYESCMHMIGQYNYLVSVGCDIKGYMFIFTDGEDNGSKHSLKEMQDALYELRNIKTTYILPKCEGVNSEHLSNIFGAIPNTIENAFDVCHLFGFVSEKPEQSNKFLFE